MPEDIDHNALIEDLCKSQIAGDLLNEIRNRKIEKTNSLTVGKEESIAVIIEANAHFPGGAARARDLLALLYTRKTNSEEQPGVRYRLKSVNAWFAATDFEPEMSFQLNDKFDLANSFWTDQYLFGNLSENTILALTRVRLRREKASIPLVYKVWLNHRVGRFVFESGRTVKCDAARAAFAAAGEGIVWAVADSGIDGSHFHFRTHRTLELPDGLEHMDFTQNNGDALRDDDGHGTHVAGIIAGETRCGSERSNNSSQPDRVIIQRKVRDSDTSISDAEDDTRREISGIAPLCRLLSLKVLRTGSAGDVGMLLAALGYVQAANNNGRNLRIHGINLSLGYTFDARWFAAGGSPLCVEVDRLVRSGVVVVVAAGNSGYGTVQSLDRRTERAAHLATISDPGNSDLAITVGSTHRDSPHSFGISYFSAKGPTADGRMKPDVVAPGERIVSAKPTDPARSNVALFQEDTGTSMAAPHVSGAIAAFLSVRREFRGAPDRVKRIFMASATDLRRRPEFQGAGLIDVMRALQSI